MADIPTSPHDAYFRKIMSHAPDAAKEIQSALTEPVAALIDWPHLQLQPVSFVTEELHSRHADLLYKTRLLDGEDVLIYILVEHQSRSDRFMAFRMLEYLVEIWRRHLGPDRDKHQSLPLVIPLVVHCNPRGWRWSAPTELSELIQVPAAMREALGAHLPRWRFYLDDLNAIDTAALCARDLTPDVRVMLVLLKHASKNPHLIEVLTAHLPDLRTIVEGPDGQMRLTSIVTYLMTVNIGELTETDLEPVIGQLGPPAKEVVMTIAERLQARGKAEGRAETLLEQLAVKFGPLPARVTAIVQAADLPQLREWTTRVLGANNLDDLFPA
jgi:predicted transposase YdaD